MHERTSGDAIIVLRDAEIFEEETSKSEGRYGLRRDGLHCYIVTSWVEFALWIEKTFLHSVVVSWIL
jgi:hypothetical protein